MGPTLAVLSVAVAVAAGAAVLPDTLTDDALADYAARPFDKAVMMERHITLGRHHGAEVVADFPCSDVCPQYTVRVIHYVLAGEADCASIGGVEQDKAIPVAIESTIQRFCVPKVLADRGL
jgi:hypothetical protein